MNFNRLRTLSYSLLLFSLPVFTFAGPVSKERAIRVAKNALLEKSLIESNLKNGQAYSVKNILAEAIEGEDLIYIINFEGGGFAIISADDNTKALLAYSTKGSINKKSMPSQLEYLLEGYKSHVIEIKEGGPALKSGSSGEWEKYDTENFTPNTLKADDAVGPLLSAEWGQSSSDGEVNWNKYTPVDANGDKTLTGCVATAAAQIMHHHAFPVYGTGATHSYTPPWDGDNDGTPDFGTLTVNYTTDYNWGAMRDKVATNESALLLYQVGVAVDMNYTPSVSLSSTSKVENVLKNYFDYSENADYRLKPKYYDDKWNKMLLTDFNKNRPVQYCGYTCGENPQGHSFVLDGYDGSLFHVNFGWNGISNGYYDIDDLGGFHCLIACAIFNIYPKCAASYNVTDDFSTGTNHYVASDLITANNSVSGSAKVAYRAGTKITLTTGFTVAAGSHFKASIKECNCSPTLKAYEESAENTSMKPENDEGKKNRANVKPTLSIYPNPNTGLVSIKNINEGDIIKIHNSNGQLVSQTEATGALATIDLKDIKNGVYFISITSDSKTTTGQIILNK